MPNKKIKDVMSAHDDRVKDDVFDDVRDKHLGNNNKSLGDVDAEGLPDVSEALIFLGMEEGWNDGRSRLEVVPFVVSRENMFNFLFVKEDDLSRGKEASALRIESAKDVDSISRCFSCFGTNSKNFTWKSDIRNKAT